MSSYSVSVIISVYNAAHTLTACLNSLKKQTLGHECIVVDDGSTDSTTRILKSYPRIRTLRVNHQGPAGARNAGAKITTGSILVFVDADMVFKEDFLEKLIQPIINGETKGTWTKEEKVMNWDNLWAKGWNLEYTHTMKPFRVPQNHPDEGPVFRAILKSEFEKVGGFDKTGYTDDWTLAQKLGYRPIAASNAIMYHANPGSLLAVWKQATWISKRHYKFGEFGRFVALIRASFPISFMVGLFRAIQFRFPFYLIFKLTYDFALCVGILEYWMTRRNAK